MIFDKMIFDKMIFDKMIFDKMIFDKMIFDKVSYIFSRKQNKSKVDFFFLICYSKMEPSVNCYNLIKRFEGCRLKAYKDPVGIWYKS
jgi:hypothetical protein